MDVSPSLSGQQSVSRGVVYGFPKVCSKGGRRPFFSSHLPPDSGMDMGAKAHSLLEAAGEELWVDCDSEQKEAGPQ